MNTSNSTNTLLAACVLLAGCADDNAAVVASRPAPLDIVLAYQPNPADALGSRIAEWQQKLREEVDPTESLERLGALFVGQARISSDPGCYELTRQCAAGIDALQPGDPAGAFLEGVVLHSLHGFADAERVARQLVEDRGAFEDQGLLGDVLLDRGQLADAFAAYQAMLDIKPCLQSYVRAARVTWLRNDPAGARDLLELAVGAGSPRDPEALAWVHSERAQVALASGDASSAERAARKALEVVPDYPPALLALGKLHSAGDDLEAAVDVLRRAAAARGEPAYLWALEDVLSDTGALSQAAEVAEQLGRAGARDDARTFALYLATRGESPQRAVELARAELAQRTDIHTHDALAWSLHQAGEHEAAAVAMQRALEHDTPDPRLWLHAGVIAIATGDREQAHRSLNRAEVGRLALLPSERRELAIQLATL